MRITKLAVLAAVLTFPWSAAAQQPAPATKAAPEAMTVTRAAALQFSPMDIPGFVPGMKIAVLAGDPGAEGTYTIRLWFPANYVFPSHWHPNAENLTVVSGTFLLGMGETTDKSALEVYKPGDYLYIPGKMPHFGGVKEETVIQLHGTGPFGLEVIEKIAGAAGAK